ncbi:MAG: SRPBCC family protein [Ktedonobacteraceae bacterium]
MLVTPTSTKNKEQTRISSQDQKEKSSTLSTLKGSTNIAPLERWASGVAGGLLTGYGITRRDWLGAGLALFGGPFIYRALTGHSYLYQALGLDRAAPKTGPRASIAHNQGIKVERAVTINKSPAELYRYWRNFANLPNFMDHLKSVQVTDNMHSHWVAKAPAGTSVEWDAEIINERTNELIAWRSLGNADIANAGSVHFMPAPGGRGTVVKVVLEYKPPAGRAGSLLAKLFGEEPDQQVREDLRHFKEMMEAGEIPTTRGQSSGRSK